MILFMLIGNGAMIFKKFASLLRVIFQPVIAAAADIVIFVLVVLLNRTNWVEKIGLDPDFHNRRHIWNMAIEWIGKNPIWGSGQETVYEESLKITGYAHSHSTYLEIAYKTGFVGSVFIVLMLAAVIVAIYRNRHDSISYILSVMLFVFGLAGIVESYPMVYVMLCMGLMYYIAKNTNETEDAENRIMMVSP